MKARSKKEKVKVKDVIIQPGEARDTDIVIPVMGPTGVGKSTFINALLSNATMAVGHDFEACTGSLQHAFISNIPDRPRLNGRRIAIVDTPGFVDTFVDDTEILRRIAVWLASSYDADMKLGGVIYLHDISKNRIPGTTRKNFDMFQSLCAGGVSASVVLGTTKWGGIRPEVGERRENQLTSGLWKDMINQGAKVRRFKNTSDSAWEIVYHILDTFHHNEALQIRPEFVDLQYHIPETDAVGKTLRYTLKQLLDMPKQRARAAQGDDPQVLAISEEGVDEARRTPKLIRGPLLQRITRTFRLILSNRVTVNQNPEKRAWERRELKVNDTVIHRNEVQYDDIIIPVMGRTGVGKSTFINALLPNPIMEVGHDLESCTRNLQHTFISEIPNRPGRLRGRRIVIVDTPGFDDTLLEDREILRLIAVWLASAYDAETKVGGVIYLHDISEARMMGTARKNFDMFRAICGEGAAMSVILGTTKWEEVRPEVGEKREDQLTSDYWGDMISQGSTVRRFKNTTESAWEIIDVIIDTFQKNEVLQIQRELVELQYYIPQTEAGKTLRYTFQELFDMHNKLVKKLEAQGDDPGVQAELEDRRNEIRKILQQLKGLTITPSPSRRIMTFFGLK